VNLPPDLKFAERFVRPFALTPDWSSLLRIFLWFLFFVITLHFAAPSISPNLLHMKEMKAANLTPLATTASDPRYMRLDKQNLPQGSFVWIAGSSITIKPNESNGYVYLPTEVQPHLPEGTRQFVSLKMASRLLDTYTMTLDVLERKPSAIVLLLNPFWTMNDKSPFFQTNMMNHGASSWANGEDWKMLSVLVSPGDLLWAAAGQHHKLIGNGYDYFKLLTMLAKPKSNNNKAQRKAEKPQKLSYEVPLLFWISQRYDTNTDFTTFDAKQWQVKAMAQNNIEESTLAEELLTRLLKKIGQSDIPTLIYIPPVSPDLEHTEARESYRTVIHQIREIANDNSADNIHFIDNIPQEVMNSMEFIDYLHLKNSGKLPEFMGQQISAMIATEEAQE
jgi:hypothetical protein